jgi:hypothetical protein
MVLGELGHPLAGREIGGYLFIPKPRILQEALFVDVVCMIIDFKYGQAVPPLPYTYRAACLFWFCEGFRRPCRAAGLVPPRGGRELQVGRSPD